MTARVSNCLNPERGIDANVAIGGAITSVARAILTLSNGTFKTRSKMRFGNVGGAWSDEHYRFGVRLRLKIIIFTMSRPAIFSAS